MRRRSAILASLLAVFISAGMLRADQPTKARDPSIPLAPGEVPDAKPVPAKTSPADPFAAITDDPRLPRVLMMGDSVSIGYLPTVRKELEGIANVHRVAANCGATKTALEYYGLVRWIKEGEAWDVIVFNHGLHDASCRFPDGNDKDKDGNYASPARGCKPYVSVEDYEKNRHAIVGILKKTGAKLFFCTTTPIPDSLAEKYVENSELPYNEAAKRVMTEEGVTVVDLWATAKPEQAKLQIPRNVHFGEEGSQVLGKSVAEAIRSTLAAGRKQ